MRRVILAVDDYCTTVDRNLAKAQEVWRSMKMILSMKEAEPWVSGFFFKYIVQWVLIFGAEEWVVPPPHEPCPGGVT